MCLGVVEFVAGDGEGVGEVGLWVEGEDAALRYFVSGSVWIIDFEGELVVSECLELEDKLFDDGAFGFDVVMLISGVVESESD